LFNVIQILDDNEKVNLDHVHNTDCIQTILYQLFLTVNVIYKSL